MTAISPAPSAETPTSDAPPAPAGRRWHRRPALWLLAPGALALLLTYALPLVWVVRMALNQPLPGGAILQTLTLSTFTDVLTSAHYWNVIGQTLQLGLLTTVFTLLLAYPVALFLARTTSRWRSLLFALAVAPLLISSVARTFGWMAILGNQGVINKTLLAIGVIDDPVRLANNMTGVVIASTEIYMPFAILAMLAGFGRLDPELERAAASLGANRLSVLRRVVLPLTAPGVITASLLVFVLSLSGYVTPRLIGGGRVFVLATEIYDEAMNSLNWPVAAVLSVLLLMLFGLVVALHLWAQRVLEARITGRERKAS
ncbi:ABC transporter permease [Streptomyces xiamenensis]|uniref:Polyamine ABC transporter permease n=1 Tax=Streptomyces xiamenensis TaxID=408015 RepID=A0A0F7FP62_9ACTN|nr:MULTISPECIES: ABC transporter permease [Streptomyces]AKG41643.1 polyamine ABC transporter permease [Streptomyces xiamenensis]